MGSKPACPSEVLEKKSSPAEHGRHFWSVSKVENVEGGLRHTAGSA